MWGGGGAWGQGGKGATPSFGKGKPATGPQGAAGKGKDGKAKGEEKPARSPEYVKGLHNQIRRMYFKFNKEKMSQLPIILQKYDGSEEELLKALKNKYEDVEAENDDASATSTNLGKANGKDSLVKPTPPKTTPPKGVGKDVQSGKNNLGKGSIVPKAAEQTGKNALGKGSIVPKVTIIPKAAEQTGKSTPGKGFIVQKAAVVPKGADGKGSKAPAFGKGGFTPPWLAKGAEMARQKIEEQKPPPTKGVGKILSGKGKAKKTMDSSSYSSKEELLVAAQARLTKNASPESRMMISRFKKQYDLGDEIELALKMLEGSQLEALINDESVKSQLPHEPDRSVYMLEVLSSFDPEVQQLVNGILNAEGEEEEEAEEPMEQAEDETQQEGDEFAGGEEEQNEEAAEEEGGEEAYQEEPAEEEAMEEEGVADETVPGDEDEAEAAAKEEQAQLIAEAQERIQKNKTPKSTFAIRKFKREMVLGDEIELALKLLDPEQLDGLLAGQADLKKELAKAKDKTQYMLGLLSDIDGDVDRLVRGLVELDKSTEAPARSRSPRGKGKLAPPMSKGGVSMPRPGIGGGGMGARPVGRPYGSLGGKGAYGCAGGYGGAGGYGPGASPYGAGGYGAVPAFGACGAKGAAMFGKGKW